MPMAFHILENVLLNFMPVHLFLELAKRLLKTFCLETSTSAADDQLCHKLLLERKVLRSSQAFSRP